MRPADGSSSLYMLCTRVLQLCWKSVGNEEKLEKLELATSWNKIRLKRNKRATNDISFRS